MEAGRKLLEKSKVFFCKQQIQLPKKTVVDDFIIKKRNFGYIVYKLKGRDQFIDILVSIKDISLGIYGFMAAPSNEKISKKYFLFGCGKESPFTTKGFLFLEKFSMFSYHVMLKKPQAEDLIKIKDSRHPAWLNYKTHEVFIVWKPINIKELKKKKYFPGLLSVEVHPISISSEKGKALLQHRKIYEGRQELCSISRDIFNKIENDFFKEILILIKNRKVINLTFLCTKYYLLDYILTAGRKFDIDLSLEMSDFKKLQDYLSEIFIEYIVFACFSELKHAKEQILESDRNWKKLLGEKETKIFRCIAHSKTFPSEHIYRIIKLLVDFPTNTDPLDILELSKKLFSLRWRDGYGGEKWKLIAETGLQYIEKKINKSTFVDTVWNIQHNNGTFFDKGHEFWTYRYLHSMLHAKNVGDWSTLTGYCKELAKKVREVERCQSPLPDGRGF